MLCLSASSSNNLVCKKLSVPTRTRTWVTGSTTQCPDHLTICTERRGQELFPVWTNVCCRGSDDFYREVANFFPSGTWHCLLLGYFFMDLRSVSCFPMVCLCAPCSSNLFSKKLSLQTSIRTWVTAARSNALTTRPSGLA